MAVLYAGWKNSAPHCSQHTGSASGGVPFKRRECGHWYSRRSERRQYIHLISYNSTPGIFLSRQPSHTNMQDGNTALHLAAIKHNRGLFQTIWTAVSRDHSARNYQVSASVDMGTHYSTNGDEFTMLNICTLIVFKKNKSGGLLVERKGPGTVEMKNKVGCHQPLLLPFLLFTRILTCCF